MPIELVIRGRWQRTFLLPISPVYFMSEVAQNENKARAISSGDVIERGAYWWFGGCQVCPQHPGDGCILQFKSGLNSTQTELRSMQGNIESYDL